jgi:hypothetical protein
MRKTAYNQIRRDRNNDSKTTCETDVFGTV